MKCILFLLLLLPVIPALCQAMPAAKEKEKGKTFPMNDKTILAFAQVNLGQGEYGFIVEVQCKTQQKNTRIEFRADTPKGKLIGALKITYTGDTTRMFRFSGIPQHAWGIHDLYLVARGSGSNLFTIHSFTFSRWDALFLF
ncbi:carbohydrate-binding protein [Chitinophaga pendula]|uniref:carbohydrate-binding protein n=1 Tax=Chitinophaga TaxID=79328 RepID=UPI0012FE2EE3|nr:MULTISPECIES: carbohydrate-binding protein [Chitinophaga]UCJ10045.1 carbohydrate-binding protein [Chitinophaga pendula]